MEGDHASRNTSKQIEPLRGSMLGCQILVRNATDGDFMGNSSGSTQHSVKDPPAYKLSAGPLMVTYMVTYFSVSSTVAVMSGAAA